MKVDWLDKKRLDGKGSKYASMGNNAISISYACNSYFEGCERAKVGFSYSTKKEAEVEKVIILPTNEADGYKLRRVGGGAIRVSCSKAVKEVRGDAKAKSKRYPVEWDDEMGWLVIKVKWDVYSQPKEETKKAFKSQMRKQVGIVSKNVSKNDRKKYF